MKKSKKAALILLAAALILSSTGCNKKTEDKKGTANALDSYVEVETDAPEITEYEPSVLAAESSYFSFESIENAGEEPLYTNPLTGLEASSDISDKRPVAIMVNNIKASLPQVGISQADIIYECLSEGGITRLLMISNDYEGLAKVGSIRSSRPYFIDFAMSHDAIYVHAGGSDDAYAAIESRDIDNLDGVNGAHNTTVFYRDPERLKTMFLEHTMVSDGSLIKQGIGLFNYRTEHYDGFENAVITPEWGYKVVLEGESAEYIKVPYNETRADTQVVEYEYDAESGKYYRWQHTHEKHIDSATGEQLAFDNIIVIEMPHVVTSDSYGHREVDTEGSGRGYYITGGKLIEIKWEKADRDSEIAFTDINGVPLVINKGKTIVNVTANDVFSQITVK